MPGSSISVEELCVISDALLYGRLLMCVEVHDYPLLLL